MNKIYLNNVEFHATELEINYLKKIKLSFSELIPERIIIDEKYLQQINFQNAHDIYHHDMNWRISHWGTNCELNYESLIIDQESDVTRHVDFSFVTAIAPPIPIYKVLASHNIRVVASYYCLEDDIAGFYYQSNKEVISLEGTPEYLSNISLVDRTNDTTNLLYLDMCLDIFVSSLTNKPDLAA